MTSGNLDRDAIVRAALAILAEHGLQAVSLRNVAAAVGARAPSLYWHVANKTALFGLMSEAIFRECLDQVEASDDWREWLHSLGTTVWHTQRRTRDVHQLMMQSSMDPEVLRGFTSRMVAELTARGLDPAIAFEAQKSVLALATGWTMMPKDPAFEVNPQEQSFLHCLDVVIRGWDRSD
ncbi:TetR family transcriptional regulator [Croceibacterium sp. LX-88]|uniref:TetR family transcriptional regulator n=1 Tax=Croceibacterium selenioxidans TaxID=2838833 RepID=A0ABS5W785_9SPHN|nr:TetR family transcriptional regulator [Croceibacterium selenioxidans]MBT2135620.1 TetR family transcriptional regulator [Croceibacterium selenioxidans]